MVWRGSICRRAGGIAGLVFLSCNTFFAQESSVQSPHSAVSDIATGSRTFRSRCAVCHGLAGAGGRGPNLSRGEFRHGVSDAALFRNISDGISGSEMSGTFLARNQVWQLVAYIRSLSHQPETNLSGDTLKGKELFRDNGDCLRCHMVNGEGGRLGPDLSDIGSVRSPDFLRTSILEPNAEVNSHYQSVQTKKEKKSTVSDSTKTLTLSKSWTCRKTYVLFGKKINGKSRSAGHPGCLAMRASSVLINSMT